MCHYSCRTCSYDMEFGKCLSCHQNAFVLGWGSRILVNERCICQSGLYDVGSVDCIEESYLSEIIVGSDCERSQYYSLLESICLECQHDCLKCVKYTGYCLKCDPLKKKVLVDGKCLCHEDYRTTEDGRCEMKQEELMGTIRKTTTVILVASLATSAPLVFYSAPMVFFQFFDIVQVLRFILYLQVNYPAIVEEFFEFFSVVTDLKFMPKLIGGDRDKMFSQLGFRNRGFDGLFLRNVQQFLQILAIIVACYGVVLGILRYALKSGGLGETRKSLGWLRGKLTRFFENLRECFEYSVFLGFTHSIYLNLAIFSMIQMSNIASMTILQSVSILVGYVGFMFVFVYPIWLIYRAEREQRVLRKWARQEGEVHRRFKFVYQFFN